MVDKHGRVAEKLIADYARWSALEDAARICDQHALDWEKGRLSAASMDHAAQARMDAAAIRGLKDQICIPET